MHPVVSFQTFPAADLSAHAHTGRVLAKTPYPTDSDLALLRCSAAVWAAATTEAAAAAAAARNYPRNMGGEKMQGTAPGTVVPVRADSLRTSLFDDNGLEDAASRSSSFAYPYRSDGTECEAGRASSSSLLLLPPYRPTVSWVDDDMCAAAADVFTLRSSVCASQTPLRRFDSSGIRSKDSNKSSTGSTIKSTLLRWRGGRLGQWCARTAETGQKRLTGNGTHKFKSGQRRARLQERVAFLGDRLAGRVAHRHNRLKGERGWKDN